VRDRHTFYVEMCVEMGVEARRWFSSFETAVAGYLCGYVLEWVSRVTWVT